MAYDPNDPADKAILDAAVKAERERLEAEHEDAIEGLKNKNTELLGRIRKLRETGGSENTGELDRLENELTETQGKLRKAEGDLRTVKRELETANTELGTTRQSLQTEQETSRNEFVQNRLTSELTAANVGTQFLEDVTASLSRQVTVKDVDGKRQAFVGDKSLGDFIKEWSQGDKGKHYVTAPANGGGGANPPGNPQGGAKKLYEMTEMERSEAYRANPTDFDKRVAAGENIAPPKS
jgi:DNA gyrase/topoisomerase IV subunit A